MKGDESLMADRRQWMTPDSLRELLRSLVTYEGGQQQLAKRLGISPQYLCDVLAARREPGNRLLAGLGCRRVVVYEILEEPETADAVDPHASSTGTLTTRETKRERVRRTK